MNPTPVRTQPMETTPRMQAPRNKETTVVNIAAGAPLAPDFFRKMDA
jgi:hypothetical protein